jgi:hypothetical protein
MINGLFTAFYNYLTPTESKIYVGLAAPLVIPGVIAGAWQAVRGTTATQAEAFAVQAVKVIDASSYRVSAAAQDPRVTYRTDEIGVGTADSLAFLKAVVGLPGDLINFVLTDADIRASWNSAVLQEQAAGVLVGIARRIAEAN